MKVGDKVKIKAQTDGETYTIIKKTRVHNFKGTKTHAAFRLDKLPQFLFRAYELEAIWGSC